MNKRNAVLNKILPKADNIMSQFTKAVTALEARAELSSEIAAELAMAAATEQREADRASLLAIKLKAAFTI